VSQERIRVGPQAAVEALWRANELLERVFNAVHVLIAYVDRDFDFVRVNEAYARADGREPGFFPGKNHFALYPNAENEAIFRRVVETGERYAAVEKPFTYAEHPERGVSYWDWIVEPVRDARGEVEGLVVSLLDVTDRALTRRGVEAAATYARSLIEASLDPLVTIAPDGRITDVNAATIAVTGCGRDELVGRDFAEFFTDPERARAGYEEAFREGAVRDYALCIRRRDGHVTPVLYNAVVYRDAAGQVVGVFAAARDVTASVRAEQALRRVNRALTTLSGCNESLVHATDEGELVRDMCRAITELGGYRMAWVGAVRHDEGRTLEPLARSGAGAGYLERARVGWGDDDRGRGPCGLAVRSGRTEIVRDARTDPRFAPWRELAEEQGFRSMLALPLVVDGAVLGVLAIYSVEADAFDPEEVKLLEELAGDLAYGIANLRERRARRAAAEKLRRSLEETVQAVATTVEVRDPYTAGHQRRVAGLARAIGHRMGLDDERVHGIWLAGTVHDVGKVRVPVEILIKPGHLTAVETDLIRLHSTTGFEILKDIEFPWPIAQIVLQHHERLDGSGYPRGLEGAAILLEARILAVADVVESMTSHRPYRPGLGVDAALKEIVTHRDHLYDAGAVDACAWLFREGGFAFA
jgi:PAS domain S-box-containing protein